MSDMTVIGNLAADAELKVTQSGAPYLKFRLMENKSRRLDDGSYETLKSQGFNVTVWGSLGEMLFERGLREGDRVKAVGEFWSRDYDKQDGSPGVAMDFTAWGVHPFDKGRDRPTPQQQPPAHQSGGYGVPQSSQQPTQQGGWGNPPQQQQQQQPQQGGGWNQPQQQQQPPAQNAPQQGGGWNAPVFDPWTASGNPGEGWGNQQ
ncbi:single-stranded DNA-binding protein [Arthrobacter sp. S41]|uniref:single-stranded DNA-binding protein n=1 Tax=Arthrobacter sp. S41 TaxID=2509721 RepID=UPI001035ABD7|nr:single-stranded DNA-binding protein [Arthrobacter sp. S41]TAP26829.1 single-stranded DNA-binding protein [Arthrobacter sp. S41]